MSGAAAPQNSVATPEQKIHVSRPIPKRARSCSDPSPTMTSGLPSSSIADAYILTLRVRRSDSRRKGAVAVAEEIPTFSW